MQKLPVDVVVVLVSKKKEKMATTTERLGIVEIKVENLNGKLDELKVDVKDMHDCLDRTRDQLDAKLEVMLDEYRDNRDKFYAHADKLNAEQTVQHNTLAGKIADLEKIKNKWTMYAMVALAFAAGTGWLNAVNFPHILKFLGL